MKVRICDKVVDTKTKREKIRNIRTIECSEVETMISEQQRQREDWQLQYVLLYIDPHTKQATVLEMWLRDMLEL